jgi:C4-dicarboxylate-specific signal transduction histidine kinase
VATLGELSGALAHELSQPLTSILSNAQAAQRFLAR